MNGQYSWIDFPLECVLYLLINLLIMPWLLLAVFVIGCLVLALLARTQPGIFLKWVGRVGLFLGLFLVVGAIFNGLWSCLVFGHLYDSADYVVDFFPCWPITQGVIDATWVNERGHLFGISLFQLQLVWFVFAAGTWGSTILLYRLIRRRLWKKRPEAEMLSQ